MQEPQGNKPEEEKPDAQSNLPQASFADKLPPEAKNFLLSYWYRAKVIVLSPKEFFTAMPTEGGYKDPMIFLAVGAGVSSLMHGLMSFNPGMAVGLFVLSYASVWIVGVAANFLAHAMGGKGSIEGSVKVFCYGTVTMLVAWIPVLNFLAGIYGIWLNFVGLKQVQKMNTLPTIATLVISYISVGLIVGLLACGLMAKSLLPF